MVFLLFNYCQHPYIWYALAHNMTSSYYERANAAIVRFEQTAKDLKILDVLQDFFSSRPGISPYTKANYMSHVVSLLKYVKKPLKKISASDLSQWAMSGKGETPASRLRTIKTFLRWLHGGTLPNDIQKLRISSKKRSHRILDEIHRMRDLAKNLVVTNTEDTWDKKQNDSVPSKRQIILSSVGVICFSFGNSLLWSGVINFWLVQLPLIGPMVVSLADIEFITLFAYCLIVTGVLLATRLFDALSLTFADKGKSQVARVTPFLGLMAFGLYLVYWTYYQLGIISQVLGFYESIRAFFPSFFPLAISGGWVIAPALIGLIMLYWGIELVKIAKIQKKELEFTVYFDIAGYLFCISALFVGLSSPFIVLIYSSWRILPIVFAFGVIILWSATGTLFMSINLAKKQLIGFS
jgi:hypothetical protein